MTIDAIQLFDILTIIWSAQLELELEPGGPELEQNLPTMTGVVQIAGGFSGALHLTCSRRAIAISAARMFAQPEDDLSEADLRDALGELTNMAAGNLKTLLPGSDDISLPTVVEGSDYGLTRLDSTLEAQTRATVHGHPMQVALFADAANTPVAGRPARLVSE